MQRRDVLAGGAAAGVATLGGCLGNAPGAVPPAPPPPGLPLPEDMDVFCDELEQKLGGISASKFVEGFASQINGTRLSKNESLSAARRARIDAHEALFRRSLSSLYLTQTFRDLPEEAQRHPRLQALMQRHLPEVDQTVFDVTNMLESLDPNERQALRRELGRRPDLPVQISEAIDERAAAAGVSKNRRRQLRSMLTQASFRLRHAAPDILIDEYTAKVRRATAPGGAVEALALEAAARATSDVFFAGPAAMAGSASLSSPNRAAGSPRASTTQASSPPPSSSQPSSSQPSTAPGPPGTRGARRQRSRVPAAPEPAPTPSDPPGVGMLRTGAWLLGIGTVTTGISALVISQGGTAMVIGVTLGALLFAIGLVVLLLGAIVYAHGAATSD